MSAATKLSALNRFRSSSAGLARQLTTKVLVVYDVQVKNPEVSHVPLIINYGEFSRNHALDKIYRVGHTRRFAESRRRIRASVRSLTLVLLLLSSRIPPGSVAPAIAPNHSRAGVIVNFVTATGGDVEMLRSIECFYKYVVAFCSGTILANPPPFLGSNAYVPLFFAVLRPFVHAKMYSLARSSHELAPHRLNSNRFSSRYSRPFLYP
jgi:hypothetical protein